MILLDIEKAFDVVWHKALVYLLNEYEVPLYIIKIILYYLKNRKFKVHIKDSKSSTRKVAAGVPQGSILGPFLFLFYINNLPKNSSTDIALFADDTAILSASWSKKLAVEKAFKHYNEIRKFFDKWKIKINDAKTELIVFSRKTKKPPSIDEQINPSSYVKYLGMHLDVKLSFTSS